MDSKFIALFELNFKKLLSCFNLNGMQPKTIAAYSKAVRKAGEHFSYHLEAVTPEQWRDYFIELDKNESQSSIKHAFYGLRFHFTHVLRQPWPIPDLVKSSKTQRLPDIVTRAQMQKIVMTTRVLSYRVFFFTLYSLGLRLGECLNLQVGDIDADRMRVHIRNAKGNKDRLVPLPETTLIVLRQFWAEQSGMGISLQEKWGKTGRHGLYAFECCWCSTGVALGGPLNVI